MTPSTMDRSTMVDLCEAIFLVYKGAHVTGDSRKVRGGEIYIAHLHSAFIIDAAKQGACCIVVDDDSFQDTNLREQLSEYEFCSVDHFISSRHYRKCVLPYQSYKDMIVSIVTHRYANLPKKIAAVTGTQGKTSVASFVMQLCGLLGEKCISIGTLGAMDSAGKDYHDSMIPLTTMALWDLYRTLDVAVEMGVKVAVIEASSHGIAQGRIAKLPIDVAAFTNLGLDHLDYHHTMEAYFEAKRDLFVKYLKADSLAILNRDIPEYLPLKQACITAKVRTSDYGRKADNLQLRKTVFTATGQEVHFSYDGVEYSFITNIISDFQVMNLMCAMGIVLGCGYPVVEVVKYMNYLTPPVGRLQEVMSSQAGTGIYIDFAHTPHALSQVLSSLIKHFGKSIILVIGCGGDRDVSKRAPMGWIAAYYCSDVVITDDNPRTESPNLIRHQIISGIEDCLHGKHIASTCLPDLDMHAKVTCRYIDIADRRLAIAHAVSLKTKDHLVIIAGKGHERYQIINDNVLSFNDYEEALVAYEKAQSLLLGS